VGASDSVVVGTGDDVVCSVTNTRNRGAIELKKVWSGTAGQTTLQIGTAAGGDQIASTPTGANGGAPLSTGQKGVDTGTFYLSETSGLTNYTASAFTCFNDNGGTTGTANDGIKNGDEATVSVGASDSVVVGTGDDVVCSVTNTRKQGKIELRKDFVGTAGKVNLYVKQGATTIDSALDVGDNGTTDEKAVDTGTYDLSETAGTGTDLANYTTTLTCVLDGTTTSVSVTKVNDHEYTVDVGYNQDVVCTFTNYLRGLVTNSSLCTFDVDATLPGNQFRKIFTPDGQSASTYKLNATNPGQFYMNGFITVDTTSDQNPNGEAITFTVPYPFVTQGATPLHAYSDWDVVSQGGATCIVPDPTSEVAHSQDQITLNEYDAGFGDTETATITIPEGFVGVVYVNVHLDYGLKGTIGWTKIDAPNPPDNDSDSDDAYNATLGLTQLSPMTFAFGVSNGSSSTDSVQSINAFKKNPGVGGNVFKALSALDKDPVVNVKVQVYQGTKLVGTVYTDADGWYMWSYKYTGKPTTFTVKLPAYGKSLSMTLKSNGYLQMDFTV
jgi:hypothetical protein